MTSTAWCFCNTWQCLHKKGLCKQNSAEKALLNACAFVIANKNMNYPIWGDEDIKEDDREIASTLTCVPLFLALDILQHWCQLDLSGCFPGTMGQLRACSGHFSHRGRTNFLGLLLFEMFIQSYDLRLLPQALCVGQQVSAQGVGRRETLLHLRSCCPFPLVYEKSCRCVTVPLQPNRAAAKLDRTHLEPPLDHGEVLAGIRGTSSRNADLSGFSKVWCHHWGNMITQAHLQLVFVPVFLT